MIQVGSITNNTATAGKSVTENPIKTGAKLDDVKGNKDLIIQFAEADTNGDGVLSEEEAYIFNNTEIVKNQCNNEEEKIYPGMSIDRTKASETLKSIDADEDGKISEKEIKLLKKLVKFAQDADNKFKKTKAIITGVGIACSIGLTIAAAATLSPVLLLTGMGVGALSFMVPLLCNYFHVKNKTKQRAKQECADLITPQTKITVPTLHKGEVIPYTFKKYADSLIKK